ncbi:MAG: TIR domain-containing protein [Methanobrevibacter sp.]|nr:TIR domain-containing protein [Methanobrevibacter sp.]
MFEEEKDDKIYNLLISKGIDGNSEYSNFVEKLYSKNDFLWKESVAGFYSNLSENFFSKIDVIVILSGLYSKNKEDIDNIVEAAIKYKKPIVLVKPQGMEDIPENLEKVVTDIVGWNANCIIDTLKEATADSS